MNTRPFSALMNGRTKHKKRAAVQLSFFFGNSPRIPLGEILLPEGDDHLVDYCVCCGAPVPEGRMVCPICEAEAGEAFYERGGTGK